MQSTVVLVTTNQTALHRRH